jgi:hypothetical protein
MKLTPTEKNRLLNYLYWAEQACYERLDGASKEEQKEEQKEIKLINSIRNKVNKNTR